MTKCVADMAPHGIIKRLRCDFILKFRNVLISNGMKHEFNVPYAAHMNSTASVVCVRYLTRCSLIDVGLPKYLWCYAVRASAYIRN